MKHQSHSILFATFYLLRQKCEHIHFGENINNQRGNKMTFVVTGYNPENSINQAPNYPSMPVNTDSMVRQYGKNVLRNILQKKFSTGLRKENIGKPEICTVSLLL